MGLKVVAIDVNDKALEVCKSQGADMTFNSMSRAGDYVNELKRLTNGGAHAAAVFSASAAAYKAAPSILRTGGILMVIGISSSPLEVSTMDLAIGTYQIKAESTSIPQRLAKAVNFTAEHHIIPEIEIRPGLEDVDQMIRDMKEGRSSKRMAVCFE